MRNIKPIFMYVIAFVLIFGIVVFVGLWKFVDTNNHVPGAEFRTSGLELAQKIQNLKAVGMGSFDSVTVDVPDSGRVSIDLDNNTVYLSYRGIVMVNISTGVDLKKFKYADTLHLSGTIELEKGSYNMRLYYGSLDDKDVGASTLVFE